MNYVCQIQNLWICHEWKFKHGIVQAVYIEGSIVHIYGGTAIADKTIIKIYQYKK